MHNTYGCESQKDNFIGSTAKFLGQAISFVGGRVSYMSAAPTPLPPLLLCSRVHQALPGGQTTWVQTTCMGGSSSLEETRSPSHQPLTTCMYFFIQEQEPVKFLPPISIFQLVLSLCLSSSEEKKRCLKQWNCLLVSGYILPVMSWGHNPAANILNLWMLPSFHYHYCNFP